MSRAAWTSVFAVSGLSVVKLIAQAPRGSISTWPVASAAMLGVEIVDDEGEMAIGLALRVGLAAPVIDGELELDVLARALDIDEGEAVEGEALLAVEAEGVAVEALGAVLVENADHRVDQSHWRTVTVLSPCRRRRRYSR